MKPAVGRANVETVCVMNVSATYDVVLRQTTRNEVKSKRYESLSLSLAHSLSHTHALSLSLSLRRWLSRDITRLCNASLYLFVRRLFHDVWRVRLRDGIDVAEPGVPAGRRAIEITASKDFDSVGLGGRHVGSWLSNRAKGRAAQRPEYSASGSRGKAAIWNAKYGHIAYLVLPDGASTVGLMLRPVRSLFLSLPLALSFSLPVRTRSLYANDSSSSSSALTSMTMHFPCHTSPPRSPLADRERTDDKFTRPTSDGAHHYRTRRFL